MEVSEILNRLRSNDDITNILNSIRANLVFEVAIAGGKSSQERSELRILDAKALANSRIKVPAAPWTLIAGDGIVSELVSMFFTVDQPFLLTFIDKACFLEDMRSQTVENAMFCSPLLVNAICASNSFASKSVHEADKLLKANLREAFYSQATKLFAAELDTPSLATTLASYVMYTYHSACGQNLLGLAYRSTCWTMYKELKLGDTSGPIKKLQDRDLNDHLVRNYKAGISRAAWGLFCIDW